MQKNKQIFFQKKTKHVKLTVKAFLLCCNSKIKFWCPVLIELNKKLSLKTQKPKKNCLFPPFPIFLHSYYFIVSSFA